MDKRLIEYLKNIVNLEKSVYIQRCAIQQISNRINGLGRERSIYKPEAPYVYSGNLLDGVLTSAFLGWIVGAAIGCFLGVPMLGVVIGPIAGGFLCYSSNKSSVDAENDKEEEKYRREMSEYNKKLATEKQRLAQEQVEKRNLSETLAVMEGKLKETTAVLNQYYARDIIFPKYRNLIAMCSIYEYFLSGRCTMLTGHEGAYNIFENEVRFERIYTKLDEVISKLEDIKSNQYVLYDAIQEGNRTTRKLVDASVKQAKMSERIANSVEISEHYNRQTALEANQVKWLLLNQAWNNS